MPRLDVIDASDRLLISVDRFGEPAMSAQDVAELDKGLGVVGPLRGHLR